MTMLETMEARRAEIQDLLAGGIAHVETRDENTGVMSEIEERDFNALVAEADDLNERIKRQRVVTDYRQSAGNAQPAVVRSEPHTYERNGQHSYLKDLARVSNIPGIEVLGNAQEAFDRLTRHAKEVEVDFTDRAARARERESETELRSTFGDSAFFEKRVNPNRTDGQGGYFVPPLWMVQDYIKALRAGRTAVNLMRHMDLPDGTDSINIPKVSTGTATGIQTADAAAVTSQDFTDTYVSAGVKTIAGQEDVALQLLEQSPAQIVDTMVTEDLAADYNRNCDRQSLNGSGSSGQVVGIRNVASVNTVTYTDSSPTLPEMWPSFGQAISQLAKNRLDGVDPSTTLFLMHPSIWYWLASQLDSSNRPVITPAGLAPYNPIAEAENKAQGFVGVSHLGFPVYVDPNILTNISSTQSEVYAIKTDDTIWFEGNLRTRVLFEILSGTLQVRFQVYNYVAQLTRYPESITVMGGTGFTPQSGY